MATHTLEPSSLDIRVEDYLDDKLQSTTDLEDLSLLLDTIEAQRSQLQTQLDDASRELSAARQTAEERRRTLIQQTSDFQALQKSIDNRLAQAAVSGAPAAVLARLQAPMAKLHVVELAQSYLELLQDVAAWRAEARSHLPDNPRAALEGYGKLRRLAVNMQSLSVKADYAAEHLVRYVERVSAALWEEMKGKMASEMETVLKARGWPAVDPASEMDNEWIACFEKLLDLQVPEVLESPSVVTLLPVDVMANILILEFRYHFLSDKSTSSPQAVGSHCFPWVITTLEKWEDFFRDNLRHLLAVKFRGTSAATKLVYVDPLCALITSLLRVVREKVHLVLAKAVKTPTFLSSFVAELMTFDETIRSRFNYDGGDAENGWPGLTSEVLDSCFETWFRAEKHFALERYQSIMSSADAGNIDYDYGASSKTRPTFGAVRITDLLRNVTDQYKRARLFQYRLRFLIGIQLEILDKYHNRLRDSLEAYAAITSTVGRTLHGVTKEQLAALEGTGALESLCKVYGSSDHIVTTLKDWSNEEFYVSMWDQLQSRAKAGDQANLAADMSYEEARDRTSATVGSGDETGILFDETIAAYTLRRQRAHDFIVDALKDSHVKAFRAYLVRVQWTTIPDGSSTDLSQLAVTPELDEPLKVLKRNLEFLGCALGAAIHRRTWRAALEHLQDLLWNDVLMRQSFTTLGAAQFLRDLDAIRGTVERQLPGISAASLSSLDEALKLLNLPVDPSDTMLWDQEAERPDSSSAEKPKTVTLQEFSDRVFTDNTEAKMAMEELGIVGLTPAHARKVLQRRVENNG